MGHPLSPFCVYTIRLTQSLDEVYRHGGTDIFEEYTTWMRGRRLFLEAKQNGMQMPVVFASAEMTDKMAIPLMKRLPYGPLRRGLNE